ncbi:MULTISPECIES: DUF397 domain-containing protein [Streptomyces]|uniref:DUF397 domain-containing protein n=1 Tax=Streptomyces rimosus subsp. rimosus (strain ATCC 10970 / DSM 40260 / JCM 4667 / NRRL 2234) TaxID=1265868 RepID=L8EUI0_STRR1|nr:MULTISPECIES: DUF397 domain-containing protein [Streptomyces]MYT48695.1 DUF397 domain-containing protein [Streptomyces sp. SID5471]QDA05261.1 DUF397 domain-containing protein [Streptomyces rimosus]QEV76540.1 DUF397 domain-containing protein [Streptomyces rimosus]QGY65796.1 DUF397 domain-containing protein [Streptomyces rimosus R6-500]QST82705.1 DUF397 domain-containing protein [Streptomyces rimosus subsp. rimosus ATCC 10970]
MDIQWQKSSKSTDAEGNCIEIAVHGGGILIRESDAPQDIIRTSQAQLCALISGAKEGRFGDPN